VWFFRRKVIPKIELGTMTPSPLGAIECQIDEYPPGIGAGMLHRTDARPPPGDLEQTFLHEVLGLGEVPHHHVAGPQEIAR
jgi:hypothetical protein